MAIHAQSQYLVTTFSFAYMKSESSSVRKDLSLAEIKRNQEYVSKTVDAVCNFLNPFAAATGTSELHNLSSGAVDLLNTEMLGSACGKTFFFRKQTDKRTILL